MNAPQIMPYDSTPFTVGEQFDIALVEAINIASNKGATKLVLYGLLQFQAAQIMQEAIVSIPKVPLQITDNDVAEKKV